MDDRDDECGYHAAPAAERKIEDMITRRDFAKLAAAGAVSSALPLSAAANKLNVGIGTYSFHSYSFDDMVTQLKKLQVAEIEMSRGEFMLMNHPADDLFKSARQKLDAGGIRCVSYYSATIKTDEDVDTVIRGAKALGASNVSGDATGGILNTIDKKLSAAGLSFGIHNHFFPGEKFAYESPEDVLKALKGLSNTCGSTADVGHFASCGYAPVESIRKLASRLKLVHLKDIETAGGEVNVRLGKGIARIPDVMTELHRQNFSRLVAIEYEKEGNVDDVMKYDVEFARKLA